MKTTTSNRIKNYRRGIWAEHAARAYLICKGYLPLATRYKTPVGEIDLVLRRGRTLVFVEVKARKDRNQAAQAIHQHNQSRVVRASQHFLVAHPEYQNHNVRFDALLIAWYRWPYHLTHAFSA